MVTFFPAGLGVLFRHLSIRGAVPMSQSPVKERAIFPALPDSPISGFTAVMDHLSCRPSSTLTKKRVNSQP